MNQPDSFQFAEMKGKETAIDAYMAIVLREAACKKETVISDWKNIKKISTHLLTALNKRTIT